jgi:hypothetical protein
MSNSISTWDGQRCPEATTRLHEKIPANDDMGRQCRRMGRQLGRQILCRSGLCVLGLATPVFVVQALEIEAVLDFGSGTGHELPYVFRLIYRRYMQKMIAFKKIGTSSLAEVPFRTFNN